MTAEQMETGRTLGGVMALVFAVVGVPIMVLVAHHPNRLPVTRSGPSRRRWHRRWHRRLPPPMTQASPRST
jgi:hypothetical protein